ncbi:Integral membrane protein [Pediococcus damnosus]|uniref:Integral membrane protein n=2 Tax=Pediococcus damnosus TaxID=51663 RepID=A0A143AI26_9LACO|nr:threonine/serine exporter family protein [Pediococcus damnosus]AMV61109.1 Integral membrane protein [Pediococcus damnosus]AMV63665.1 Integral membrane protein [Pediococcus damnosus]AMV65468.1 Integral membrane protein [Pediococcus damnosus]AMV66396.1 Integral membrane protein [Pediococcus damnosus]KJU74501.1 membrane protein [Pediococcus damnosus LMG 28219]
MIMIIKIFFAFIATIGFGIIINIPHRALVVAGLIGVVAWLIYWGLFSLDLGLALSNLVAAVAIGILSDVSARKMKMPMLIFNIPSLVPLVPGGQAYQMIRTLALGETAQGVHFLTQVIEITGSIAIGFLIAELLNKLWKNLKVQRTVN